MFFITDRTNKPHLCFLPLPSLNNISIRNIIRFISQKFYLFIHYYNKNPI